MSKEIGVVICNFNKKDFVLESVKKAEELSGLCGLPVKLTSIEKRHLTELNGKIENLFLMTLQEKYFQIKENH